MSFLTNSVLKRTLLLNTGNGTNNCLLRNYKVNRNFFLSCSYVTVSGDKKRNKYAVQHGLLAGQQQHRCMSLMQDFGYEKENLYVTNFSYIRFLKLKFLVYFLKNYVDVTFSIRDFVSNAEKAFCIVAEKLASGEQSVVAELFMPATYRKLKKLFKLLPPSYVQDIKVDGRTHTKSYIRDIKIGLGTDVSAPIRVDIFVLIVDVRGEEASEVRYYIVGFSRTYGLDVKNPWLISSLDLEDDTLVKNEVDTGQ